MPIVTATIAAGASVSGVINVSEGFQITGIKMPTAWTAAALTFQACEVADGTFADVYDVDGVEVRITAANALAGRWFVVQPVVDYMDFRFFKLRSGISGTPVNQAETRTFVIMYEPRH